MKCGAGIFGCVLALLLLGCGSQSVSPHQGGQGGTSTDDRRAWADPGEDAPPGWRWESFERIQIAVPNHWGHGTTYTPWCMAEPGAEPLPPYVGRPGPIPLVGCDAGDLAKQLDPGGTFVWFHGPADNQAHPRFTDGDRTTVVKAGTRLSVQAPTELRQRILSTLRTVQTDHNGCPTSHQIGGDPAWRPAPDSRQRVQRLPQRPLTATRCPAVACPSDEPGCSAGALLEKYLESRGEADNGPWWRLGSNKLPMDR